MLSSSLGLAQAQFESNHDEEKLLNRKRNGRWGSIAALSEADHRAAAHNGPVLKLC